MVSDPGVELADRHDPGAGSEDPAPGFLVVRRAVMRRHWLRPYGWRGADSRPVTLKSLPTSTVTRCPLLVMRWAS